MKVIISHDIDHITAWEHNKDLIIPKSVIRAFIELGSGYISASEIICRLKNIISNKWHNLENLIEFDRENNVASTFFIAVSNGMGLKYSLRNAEFWIKKILQEGGDIGVHGISFDSHIGIKEEYERFKQLSGLDKFGIRMHYLRNSKDTLNFLAESGYMFDTTLYKLENPFKVNGFWEFPLHIMDGYIFYKNSRWQNQCKRESQDTTKRLIENGINKGIEYFTILFHDNYFSDSFKTWKEWYIWLIGYMKENKFRFVSYKEAIKELEDTHGQ